MAAAAAGTLCLFYPDFLIAKTVRNCLLTCAFNFVFCCAAAEVAAAEVLPKKPRKKKRRKKKKRPDPPWTCLVVMEVTVEIIRLLRKHRQNIEIACYLWTLVEQ